MLAILEITARFLKFCCGRISKRMLLTFNFHRQVPMLDYIVDFYCHELMLAIEIDGNSHDFKYDYDVQRQGRLEEYGVKFIRFTDSEVKKEMFSVLLTLNETIELLKKETQQ